MCLVMLIEGSVPALIGGIFLGVAGLALCGVNYLIYKKLAAKRRGSCCPSSIRRKKSWPTF